MAVTSCTPEDLKKILELFGYKLYRQDSWNWSMVRGVERPVIIPKCGELVSLDVLNAVFTRLGMASPQKSSRSPSNTPQ
jgi:hypothetical protein